MFEGIPQEMRDYQQWIVWRYEDLDAPKPVKVPYCAKNGRHAKVNDPSTWGTYEQAVAALSGGQYSGLGFMLSRSDPFAFIDLDDPYELKPDGTYKHKDPQATFDDQYKVFTEFDTFAEKSPSGKGLHLILRGSVEAGRRRSSIEVYSSDRFMTMTGNVYRNAPIKEYNQLLQVLWQKMGNGASPAMHYAGLAEPTDTDKAVIEQASNASNGEKFAALYSGDWQSFYGSQSEADLALIDIIAFYTQNRAQIVRIFRESGLGQRDKASREDYVNYMLNKCFDRMLPPVDVDGLRNDLEAAIAKAKTIEEEKIFPTIDYSKTNDEGPILKPKLSIYNPPPGLVGQLAQFIYAAAPRPVPEIALAGAIGLMAGIVGRSYNVSNTGLNQYVLLLAPTGTGKEAIARGINKLMASITRSVPSAIEFMGPAEISSQQALTKYLGNTSKCFVSVVGEFGIQLKLMASPSAPPHLTGLMRMILDLFNKSGEGDVLRPSIYSDREKNTAAVLSPAFTWLGESTPEKFYESLDESMITSGLLPRFTTIEYNGDRPPLNENHMYAQPSFELVEKFATLASHSLQLNSQNRTIQIGFTEEASLMFKQFNEFCDDRINNAERELRRQLWNRAHLKAMKLAGLIAVGQNPYEPKIDYATGKWAIDLIVADVNNLLGKFDAGEIGTDSDENKQIVAVVNCIREYALAPFSEIEKYVPGMGHLHGEKIIPYSYLQRRLAGASLFRRDKRGASDSLKRSIKTLVERGDLQEVSKAKLATNYKTTAMCFMIAVPRVFGL